MIDSTETALAIVVKLQASARLDLSQQMMCDAPRINHAMFWYTTIYVRVGLSVRPCLRVLLHSGSMKGNALCIWATSASSTSVSHVLITKTLMNQQPGRIPKPLFSTSVHELPWKSLSGVCLPGDVRWTRDGRVPWRTRRERGTPNLCDPSRGWCSPTNRIDPRNRWASHL